MYRKGQRIFQWLGGHCRLLDSDPEEQASHSKGTGFAWFARWWYDHDLQGYGDNLESEADSLAEDASKIPPGGDLDDILPPSESF